MNDRFIQLRNQRRKKMAKTHVSITEYFIVRDRTSGGAYLALRRSSNANQPKYRWSKGVRSQAVRMTSYDTAQKARQRYGGDVIRCTRVKFPEFSSLTLQSVVSVE